MLPPMFFFGGGNDSNRSALEEKDRELQEANGFTGLVG